MNEPEPTIQDLIREAIEMAKRVPAGEFSEELHQKMLQVHQQSKKEEKK